MKEWGVRAMAGSCSVVSPAFIFTSPQRSAPGDVDCSQPWLNSGRPRSSNRRLAVECSSSPRLSTLGTCSVSTIGINREEEEEDGRASNQAKNALVFRPPLEWPVNSSNLQLLDELVASRPAAHSDRFMLGYGVEVESTPPPPKQKKEEKGKDYHVNVGYAIRSLREELPGMFYKEPKFDIYRDDITFRDPLITFSGIANYKLMFWALRFYGRIFFKTIWIDIQRIWQPRDKVIMVRWTVHGIPRVPWEARGQFDATSEYKLDSEGLIYEHKIDNLIMNSPPKYRAPAVIDLVAAAGGAHTPTPSYYYQVLLLARFTWVRYYLALRGTLVLNYTVAGLSG